MPGTTLVDRSLLRLSGADVRIFLQGLVTQDVNAVAEGRPQWSGLLSPQGKALFDFLLWADGDDLLVDCEAAEAETLARRLALYRLRRAIAIAPEPGLAVHWAPAGAAGVPDPRLAALGRRWLAPAGEAAEGWLAHRLALGVTEGVAELGRDRTLWLECNAAELNGVSFVKGCYVGQENTARMNWRQKVNRRLVVVETTADPGDAAQAWYPELGLAVARVRVEALSAPLPFGTPMLPGWLKAAIA
ncbi:YgfZ/GcvT domain-containing protein [Sphingomonas flavalba]|uniref:CAF17-like 4Fe-4S cluster assembly/insertion protein YgfZ n=1 Tax=Sphingomonas flavalba TaxID=2559804 RepID=UPI00109DE7BB|nr:folate-binding protein [Sphingomonas flavalba]